MNLFLYINSLILKNVRLYQYICLYQFLSIILKYLFLLLHQVEDEFDFEENESKKIEDGSIIVNAKMEYKLFNEKYGNIFPNGDYETVGGYIINKIGRIPHNNEHLFLSIGHVIIKKASSRRIEQIQIFFK